MIGEIAKALLGDTLDTVIDRVLPDVNLRNKLKGLVKRRKEETKVFLG